MLENNGIIPTFSVELSQEALQKAEGRDSQLDENLSPHYVYRAPNWLTVRALPFHKSLLSVRIRCDGAPRKPSRRTS